jgi:mannose-6-phosphate isomerase class I
MRKKAEIKSLVEEKLWGRETWLVSDRNEGCGEPEFWVKKIEAVETLSVQVHDNKSETWYNCGDGDCEVYAGLKAGVDLAEVIRSGKWEELLRTVAIPKGWALHIPVGTVHAIKAGSVLYEVSDPVDRTLRLWDWNRGRELHLEEGIAAVNQDNRPEPFEEKLKVRGFEIDIKRDRVFVEA